MNYFVGYFSDNKLILITKVMMSISSTKKSKVDLGVVLSLVEYKIIVRENSSFSNEYLKVGHLYPEKNTPQYRWLKEIRDRGIRGDIAA